MDCRLPTCFIAIWAWVAAFGSSASEHDNPSHEAQCNTGKSLPLVGIGVGNLAFDRMDDVVGHALRSNVGYQVIDAAMTSEKVLAVALDKALVGRADTVYVHVITKIWYTHLGYGRTKLAVQESIASLRSSPSTKHTRVHILLHWPRCDDAISWMDCEGEEARLPQYVKDAGPPPHLDRENAWKGSWNALSEMYSSGEYDIEGIGVSNFGYRDFKMLLDEFQIKPHLLQGNVWTLLHDPDLMKALKDNRVVFQVYNVMNGIVLRSEAAPNAYHLLDSIGREMAGVVGRHEPFPVATIILAWLVQQGVSVIPRASSLTHQLANAPLSLSEVPALTISHREKIEKAVSALLLGNDIDGAIRRKQVSKEPQTLSIAIHNALSESPMFLYWLRKDGKEILQHSNDEPIEPGSTKELHTHPGHTFVAYNVDRSIRQEFKVEVDYGQHQAFIFKVEKSEEL